MSDQYGILVAGLYKNRWPIVFISDIQDLRLMLDRHNTFRTPCFKWSNPQNPGCEVFEIATVDVGVRSPVYEVLCKDDIITPLNVARLFAYLCESSGAEDILVHFRNRPGREVTQEERVLWVGVMDG